MTSTAKTSKGTDSAASSDPVIDIIHYADPFCWWSWGLEPIISRLKEVYGEQVAVTYRMGGMAEKIDHWRRTYDVASDKALHAWIDKSVAMTGMSLDRDFVMKSAAQSSWPACVAVKAAELQDKARAARFFRKLMEAIQLRAANVSEEHVYLAAAQEVGLDPAQLRDDISSGRAAKLFETDRKEMNVNFLTLALVNRRTKKSKAIGGVFTSKRYEDAVDELAGGKLGKQTPTDILEYFMHHQNHLIPAKEIAVVFGIPVPDAEKRLAVLAGGDLLRPALTIGDQKFWTAAGEARDKARELTMEQSNAARIAKPAR